MKPNHLSRYIASMKATLLVVLALCFYVGTSAQMMMPKYLFPTATAAGRQFPKVTRAPDGTLVLAFAVKSGDAARFRCALSTDGGLTWSGDHFFMQAPYGGMILQRQPYVIMDSKRVLHAVGQFPSSMGMYATHYAQSVDLGATWTTPKEIKPTDMRHMDFSSIAVDSSGTIYISYISNSKDATDKSAHDFIIRSTTNGMTWTPEVRVDNFAVGGSCECCTQNIEVGPDGEVAVAFRSNINNRRDIHVARSSDGGATFATPVNIQSGMWMIGGCPATGPALKYDLSGTLHISWRDARSSKEPGTCFYAALPRGSTTTPTNINLTTGFSEDAEYPVVAVTPDGQNVAVTWGNPVGVYLATSTDGGTTFTKDTIATGTNAYPNAHVVFTPSGPFTLWQTRRGTVTDIALSTLTTTAVKDSDGDGTPNTAFSRTVCDLMGRVVYTSNAGDILTSNTSDVQSDGTAFTSGVYCVIEETSNGVRRRMIVR